MPRHSSFLIRDTRLLRRHICSRTPQFRPSLPTGILAIASGLNTKLRHTDEVRLPLTEKTDVRFAGQILRLFVRGHWEFIGRSPVSEVVVILVITDEDRILPVEQFPPPVNFSCQSTLLRLHRRHCGGRRRSVDNCSSTVNSRTKPARQRIHCGV